MLCYVPLARVPASCPRIAVDGQDGWTPLHRAVFTGRGVSVVKVLLQAGADPAVRPHVRACEGGTEGGVCFSYPCLFCALQRSHASALEQLLEAQTWRQLVVTVLGALALRGTPAPRTSMPTLVRIKLPSCCG